MRTQRQDMAADRVKLKGIHLLMLMTGYFKHETKYNWELKTINLQEPTVELRNTLGLGGTRKASRNIN